MKIKYVAFDSFGVKSMCTQVKTKDTTITIDPGVAVESTSYPLPLKKRETLVKKYHKKIKNSCRRSEFVIITHYHYDHHMKDIDFYRDKKLIVKDPVRDINRSQKKRAHDLMDYVVGEIDGIAYGDNNTFIHGSETVIAVSKPLWHGQENTKLGFVLMLEITDNDKRLLYTSDLNGIYMKEHADKIIRKKPDILIMDGFPSYLLGYVASYRNLKSAIENTIRIIENTECNKYILDHHLLRDYRYREIYHEVYKRADQLGKKVTTAAEDLGKKPMVLEAYEKYGPTKWKKWDKMSFKKLDELLK